MSTPAPDAPATAPRRKRSTTVALTAIGALSLTACDEPPPQPVVDEVEQSRLQFGEGVDAMSYASVGECIAAGQIPASTCQEASDAAAKQNAAGAPRFDAMDVCEEQHGAGACAQQVANNGQSYFSPLLTGFIVGQMLGGPSRYQYSGAYRGRDGRMYTGGGTGGGYLYRNPRTGGMQVGRDAIAPPAATPRVQTRSSVVSRGGFGGRATASSRGGWGGSGGFGG
jgi:uncharacterized protein YgiB involved in biofilm formation